MTLKEAIYQRHSVRRYTDRPLGAEVVAELQREIAQCAEAGELQIRLCQDEPEAFGSLLLSYGWLSGVRNYILLAGEPREDLEERVGYYGERIVLRAQQLGLNTCWVAGTYKKGKAERFVEPGKKLCCVIAVGYGVNQGSPRRSKPMEKLSKVNGETPEWFRSGMEAAMLAPTAINQQKFCIELSGNVVRARALKGPYSRVDLGIVKYHFEIGAEGADWRWEEEG